MKLTQEQSSRGRGVGVGENATCIDDEDGRRPLLRAADGDDGQRCAPSDRAGRRPGLLDWWAAPSTRRSWKAPRLVGGALDVAELEGAQACWHGGRRPQRGALACSRGGHPPRRGALGCSRGGRPPRLRGGALGCSRGGLTMPIHTKSSLVK
jgi:hypothetical protein